MVHRPEQEEITDKPTGSIDTSKTSDKAKPPENASKPDGWKGENRKYKTRRSDPIKSETPKFSGRCTGLSGFIYDLGPNQTDEYIKTTIEIEDYVERIYGTEVRKSTNELDIKVSVFINPEELTMHQQLSIIHIEIYKLKF